MKRQVFVPLSCLVDGEIPNSAIDLASEMQLPIEVGTGHDERSSVIGVVEIPEKAILELKSVVKSGFIQVINCINEFADFRGGIECTILCPNGSLISSEPSMLERHRAVFKIRFHDIGKYEVTTSINAQDGTKIIQKNEFEVV